MKVNEVLEKNYCEPINEYEGYCTTKDQIICMFSELEFGTENICQHCSDKKFLRNNKRVKKCFSLKAIQDSLKERKEFNEI